MKQLTLKIIFGVLTLFVTSLQQTTAADDLSIAPAKFHVFGKSLTSWSETYWRWFSTGSNFEQSQVNGVQLVSLPDFEYMGGEGTYEDPVQFSGTLEITLPVATPFMLGTYSWIGEKYLDGSEDAYLNDNAVLDVVHPKLKIDGITVLSEQNKARYYVPTTEFDPTIEYEEPTTYGAIGAFYFTGIVFPGKPLSPGVHKIHLYQSILIPYGKDEVFDSFFGPDGHGVIYDLTWIVTVPKPTKRPLHDATVK